MVRLKHRYLLVKIVIPDERFGKCINSHDLNDALKSSVENLYGDYGLACISTSLNIKYLNVLTHLALVRVRRKFHRLLWSAIPMVKSLRCSVPSGKYGTSVQSVECIMNTLYCSGTIRSVQKFIIKHNRKEVAKASFLQKYFKEESNETNITDNNDTSLALEMSVDET